MFVWLSLLLWSASIDLPASLLVAYRLPPVVSRFSAPLRATRSTFLSCPYRFPFRRVPSTRRLCPARAFFPLCRALFARRSRSSFWFSFASCVTRSASLPVRPVSRSVPCRAFSAHIFFFLSFAGYYFTRRKLCSLAVC